MKPVYMFLIWEIWLGKYRGTITSTTAPDLLYRRIKEDKVNKKVSMIKEGGDLRLLCIDVLPSKHHMAANRKIWATWFDHIGIEVSNRRVFREVGLDQPITLNDVITLSTRLSDCTHTRLEIMPHVAYREAKLKELNS